ncbi:hypothetical protein AGMMS49928_21170 [Spirochaetia bacterium]|nr:hypothetical protein AGMMS49928_21170 [Spirochaetia bacterium]
MSALLSLAVFSGLALNLVLQFASGIRGTAVREDSSLPVFQLIILLVSTVFLWFFFHFILDPLGMGFFEYPLLFPLSALVCFGLESLCLIIVPLIGPVPRPLNPLTSYNGLALAAAFITIELAVSVAEALALSLGFSLGVFVSLLLLKEIRIRSYLETVPPFLRGGPLALISMGLLSLVFFSAAAVCFRLLGVY